jgi:hypothetical protein
MNNFNLTTNADSDDRKIGQEIKGDTLKDLYYTGEEPQIDVEKTVAHTGELIRTKETDQQ